MSSTEDGKEVGMPSSVMQSVLALLKGGRVILDVAWRVLSPKCSLITSGVRTYYTIIYTSVHFK
jgi:hypothetical protein